MLATLPRPAVFAHRGASAHAPENTMASFALAQAEGADAIELDTKLTADGQVVVLHDETLDRTTDGSGRVTSRTLNELSAFDAGCKFAGAFRGEKIPCLDQVLETFGKKLFIVIDLNNYTSPWDDLVPRVCESVRRQALEGQIIFSSFLASNLRQAARRLPDVPRALLARPGWKGRWARSFGFSFGDYAALHAHASDVTIQQVNRVHRLRRRIHVWTVNTAQDLRRLAAWGVDGVFTDDPRLALETLGRRP